MFDEVRLVEWDEGIALAHDDGAAGPLARPRVPVEGRRYWLLPKLRWSAIDPATLRPIQQELSCAAATFRPTGHATPSPE